jgi:plastocyanin
MTEPDRPPEPRSSRSRLAVVGGVAAAVGITLLAVGSTSGGVLPRTIVLLVLLGGIAILLTVAVQTVLSGWGVRAPAQDRPERRRAFAVRLVVLGFAMVPVSLLIAVAAGNPTGAADFMIPAAIAIVLAFAVGFFGRFFVPAAVFAALLTLLALAANELVLRHPESFETFVPAVWMLLGSALAAVAAVVGTVQRRRHTLAPARSVHRVIVGAGMVLLIAGSAVSWGTSGASRVPEGRAKGALIVAMHDSEFDPDELTVARGKVARFYLRNSDSEAHTFTIDALALDEYVGPRGDRLVSVEIPADVGARTLALSCAVTGHENMDGTIVVREVR